MSARIVQVANFVTPTSGGLRTALEQLAAGYAAHGHEVVQVLPGPADSTIQDGPVRRVEVASPLIPGTGYRLVTRPGEVARLLGRLAPDRLEVHDRTTLRGLGRWAASAGVPSLVVSHERLDRVLGQWLPQLLPLAAMADRSNAALAASYDAVVCTTDWAAQEFTRLGVRPAKVPLGVDLERFCPGRRCWRTRDEVAADSELLLLTATRLSKEKQPHVAIDALAELVRRGVRARLVVAGDGPQRAGLERRAAGLPVTFLGFVRDRDRLARLLATADVVLAPGPVETFGLAALEALASGTPAVVRRCSALPEVVGPTSAGLPPAGLAVPGTARAFADAVQVLAATPGASGAARRQAELFPWSATVEGFLAVHRLAPAVLR